MANDTPGPAEPAASLERVAEALGIEPGYHDIWGGWRRASDETLRRLVAARRRLPRRAAARAATSPAVGVAWTPPAWRDAGRCWGYAIQLYALRSDRNWGIGDLTDLAGFARLAAAHGASLVGLNPLHALRLDEPGRCSPYAASNRHYLHPIWIDVEAIPEYRTSAQATALVASDGFQRRLHALRARDLVDHAGVLGAKLKVLRLVYRTFRQQSLDAVPGGALAAERRAAFERFVAAEGRALACHARHDALQGALRAADPTVMGWRSWPAALRDPDGAAVRDWALAHRDEVEFHAWLQWVAGAQLEAAHQAALGAGMAVGLYRDLALGVEPDGSEAWAGQDAFAFGVSSGAPPDDLNVVGQCWGLLPFDPDPLAVDAAPLARVLASNMRSAGLLRLDHVMALQRLFWVPEGMPATEGAYVRYPLERLLEAVCAQSRAAACGVVGEDLGTVPDALRQALAAAGILGYRLLYFERETATRLRAVERYPRGTVAAIGTHDLPPLAGWWCASDLDSRDRLGLWPPGDLRERVRWDRGEARYAIVSALREARLLPPEVADAAAQGGEPPAPVRVAVHALLARSSSAVVLVQPEDALGLTEANNIPGTVDEHPNWRRKLPVTVSQLAGDQRLLDVAAACRAEGR